MSACEHQLMDDTIRQAGTQSGRQTDRRIARGRETQTANFIDFFSPERAG